MSISGSVYSLPEEIAGLVMPQGYKDSIATWLTQHAPAAAGSR